MYILVILILIAASNQILCISYHFYEQNEFIYSISKIAAISFQQRDQCYSDLSQFKCALENHKQWAIRMFDASGGPAKGFTYGNNLWLGSRFQCIDLQNRKPLELNHDKQPNPSTIQDGMFPPFELAFSKVFMKQDSSVQITTGMALDRLIQLGLCLPKSCNAMSIERLVKTYVQSENCTFKQFFNSTLCVESVQVLREDSGWILERYSTRILIIMSVPLIVLVSVATFVDIMRMKRCCFVQCLSLRTNIRSLLNTSVNKKNGIPAVNGIRFFGMLWIIAVHSIFYGIDYFANIPEGFRLGEALVNQVYSNSSYCVDTFFFLSGFLLSYLFYKQKGFHILQVSRRSVITLFKEYFVLYLNRILRLTYPYVITILLSDVLFAYFRETSTLHSSECSNDQCSRYVWRNLLYINNLYPRSEMCLSWSWYLSVDSQCFLIATALLLLSTILFKLATFLLITILLTCILSTTLKCYSIGYIPTMDDQLRELDAIYDLPWNRMGPYLIGLITGYVLVRYKKHLVFNKRLTVIYWIIFPSVNMWIIFGIYGRQMSVMFAALYMGLSRTLWGVGIAWILVACTTRQAGIVNRILSYSAWVPFSKLTYCAYLINPIIANSLYLMSDTAFNVNVSQCVFSMFGVTVLTFATSFFYTLFFEIPIVRLAKLLQTRKPKMN